MGFGLGTYRVGFPADPAGAGHGFLAGVDFVEGVGLFVNKETTFLGCVVAPVAKTLILSPPSNKNKDTKIQPEGFTKS